MPGAHRPLIRPHRPDYVPAGSRYQRTRVYRPRPVHRVILGLLVAALIFLALAVLTAYALHTTHTPGGTMPSTKYSAPVIPGPDGARRATLAQTAAAAARPGEPGHLEKLFDQHAIHPAPVAVWRTADRWRDLTNR
jgi:hypothetical protein